MRRSVDLLSKALKVDLGEVTILPEPERSLG